MPDSREAQTPAFRIPRITSYRFGMTVSFPSRKPQHDVPALSLYSPAWCSRTHGSPLPVTLAASVPPSSIQRGSFLSSGTMPVAGVLAHKAVRRLRYDWTFQPHPRVESDSLEVDFWRDGSAHCIAWGAHHHRR